MEVIGDGDHEQSFLVPRFERAKRRREGIFSTVTFNSDNAIFVLFPCYPLHIHTSNISPAIPPNTNICPHLLSRPLRPTCSISRKEFERGT